MKVYLLAYSDALGSREQVKAYLNSMEEVAFWRYDLPHMFYIMSDASSKALAQRLRTISGEKGRFIISEITENRFGWLSPESANLIMSKAFPRKRG
jgi:hypothetical protein